MPDEVDKANDLAEVLLDAAIRASRPRLRPTGSCFNCGESLMTDIRAGSLFCDEFCRDDYEKQEKMRTINGR